MVNVAENISVLLQSKMERTNRKQRYWRYTAWVMTLLAYAYLAYRLLTYDDWSSLAVCLRTAERAADFFGWTRIPFRKDGAERDVDEKNAEIYRILRAAID